MKVMVRQHEVTNSMKVSVADMGSGRRIACDPRPSAKQAKKETHIAVNHLAAGLPRFMSFRS